MTSSNISVSRWGFARTGWFRFKSWLGPRPLLQLLVLLAVIIIFAYLGRNLVANMAKVGMSPGFGFLALPANFAIGESLISYSPQDSYGRAILVGVLNTLLVASLGCISSTGLGVALGILRLSTNPLLSGLVRAYVEIIRNTPLLLQLFFWSALAKALPAVRQAFEPLPGLFLSNRGFNFPALVFSGDGPFIGVLAVLLLALVVWIVVGRILRERLQLKLRARLVIMLAAILGIAVLLPLSGTTLSWPVRQGFNITGGNSWSPELAIITFGLIINAAAGIAEIVRGGIQSIAHGQWEAGRSLGLTSGQILRLIVLPQAMRIIVPLLISSYLSLTKNSSLAVAIGYPDLVSIVNTTANQSGHALEAILVMMAVYLAISLIVSLTLNIYHHRTAFASR